MNERDEQKARHSMKGKGANRERNRKKAHCIHRRYERRESKHSIPIPIHRAHQSSCSAGGYRSGVRPHRGARGRARTASADARTGRSAESTPDECPTVGQANRAGENPLKDETKAHLLLLLLEEGNQLGNGIQLRMTASAGRIHFTRPYRPTV